MKTNFELWLELKRLTENKERILLFYSGVFYKTFESDAEFLSTLFGFQVLTKGGYEVIGFPITMTDKYLPHLRQAGYSYQIIQFKEEILDVVDTFDGDFPLKYDRDNVVFRQEKPKKTEPPS